MKKLDREALLADREVATHILKTIPDDDLAGRASFESRLEEIDAQLKRLEGTPETKGAVALVFGGEPVFGSRSIDAEFATAAVRTFQNLVKTRIASEEIGQLGARGPIPYRSLPNLAITELVRGSMGFMLEEASPQDEIADTAVKIAIDEVAQVIALAGSQRDEDFEKAVENLDGRSLVSLKLFFRTLDDSHATVRLVEEERDETLDTIAVRRARQRIEATQIRESEADVRGELLGLLPQSRRFEMRLDETGETIKGTVGATLAEQWLPLIEQSNEPLVGRRWRTRMKIREVRERNREPKRLYTLLRVLEKL